MRISGSGATVEIQNNNQHGQVCFCGQCTSPKASQDPGARFGTKSRLTPGDFAELEQGLTDLGKAGKGYALGSAALRRIYSQALRWAVDAGDIGPRAAHVLQSQFVHGQEKTGQYGKLARHLASKTLNLVSGTHTS